MSLLPPKPEWTPYPVLTDLASALSEGREWQVAFIAYPFI